MASLAIGLGVYAYLILALGLLGLLYRLPIALISIAFICWGIIGGIKAVKNSLLALTPRQLKKLLFRDKLVLLIFGILGLQVIVNFIGAISPELSFDALWYHLTPAKLYTQNNQIFHIPGWLLWPANLPRLIDLFYTVALLFSDEILAKLIHFSFGILSAIALFNLLKRYLNLQIALLGVLTFYTMLVVGWQSTTAYVDLGRTFFEILALDYFLRWVKDKKDNNLVESAVFTGLAISSKILALGTLGILGFLIFIINPKGWSKTLKFIFIALLIVSPWFIRSFINTGNPIFPLFGNLKDISSPGINPDSNFYISYLEKIFKLPILIWNATIKPDDIISPIYLIFLPLILLLIWKQSIEIKLTAVYTAIGIILSPIESTRYLLPYLPGFTLVTVSILNDKWIQKGFKLKIIIAIIIFSALLNFGSRAIATKKFVPYFLGKESKSEFLSHNLNFQFGDFYDVDGWFTKNIDSKDLVLIYGIHNLYYLNFPYVHESWAKKGTYFTHILVGDNQKLLDKFGKRLLLYQNHQTGVKVYLYGEKYQ